MDATRVSDKRMVLLKRVDKSVHPYEVEIGQYFSASPVASDPRNRCCPIYEVLEDPTDGNMAIIVMPHLRKYNSPGFETVGEVVEFFRQVFEVIVRVLSTCSSFLSLDVGPTVHARTSCRSSVRVFACSTDASVSRDYSQRLHGAQHHDGRWTHVSQRVSPSRYIPDA